MSKNYKTLMVIQVIAVIVLGLLVVADGESYNILATILVVFCIGLLAQTLLYYFRPKLFSDKVRRHPHKDL